MLQTRARDRASSRRCVFLASRPSEHSATAHLPLLAGANFRKATTPSQAFPAALQDALTVHAHLVLDLGYRHVVLAGDSAGGSLALMLTQYLATLCPRRPASLVLPSGLLLLSPWSDLTASTCAVASHSRFEDDIICASMATNSIWSFLLHVNSPRVRKAFAARGQASDDNGPGRDSGDSVYALGAQHAFFSPALPTALPSLTRTAQAYLDGSRAAPLRILVTTGSAELFHLEIVRLVDNLRAASRAAVIDAGPSRGGGASGEVFEVELLSAEGEVHAFPLVPEWVSPAAGTAMEKMREWALEGTGRDAREEKGRRGEGDGAPQ